MLTLVLAVHKVTVLAGAIMTVFGLMEDVFLLLEELTKTTKS